MLRNQRLKIILIIALCIFLIAALSLMFFRPTPSDEEIPRGSRRVVNIGQFYEYHIFQI